MTTISSPQAHVSPAHVAATRAAWHRVAQHVLAAAVRGHRPHRLAPAPDGFQTPPFGVDGAYLAVDGTDLVVGDVAGARRTPLTTVRAAASFAGITAGAPARCTGRDTTRPGPAAAHRSWRGTPAGRLVRPWRARHEPVRRGHPGRAAQRRGALAGALRPRHHRKRGQLRRLARRQLLPRPISVRKPARRAAARRSSVLECPVRGDPHHRANRHRCRGGRLLPYHPGAAAGRPGQPPREDVMKGLDGKVALVTGGSSGRYPGHCGSAVEAGDHVDPHRGPRAGSGRSPYSA